MRFIFSLIISFFLIFPSYAYDEKIKLNRISADKDSKKETIKISLNKMIDFKEIKKASRNYASIELYQKEVRRKIFKKGKRKKYKGTAVKIFEDNVGAVVFIGNDRGGNTGAGTIVSEKGEIITNWHVVGNAKKLNIWLLPDNPDVMYDDNILWTKPNFIGTVVHRNKGKDLALVKIEGLPKNIKVIQFGKTSNVKVGSNVFSIGHPDGAAWTYNSGMVTQIRPNHKWSYKKSSHNANVIQHEVPTNPGNSGGPLLDDKGLMVGVNSFVTIDSQLVNFAVAIDEVEAFLKEEIKEDETVYIKKKINPSYITKKCKEKSKYLQKKCKKKQSSDVGKGLKKTFSNAKAVDTNKNGEADTWYIDDDKNGKIDTAFLDLNEDGIIEAIMLDVNENKYFEIITFDKDLNGSPDLLYMDRDEDGEDDVIAYDYNQDGEWDKFENINS